MSPMKRLFKSKTEESWTMLADEMDGQFIKRKSSRESDKVMAKVNGWTITLDIETLPRSRTQPTSRKYTRMQAPYVGETDFLFSIRPMSGVSRLGKRLGMQDIEVGDPEFDRYFMVSGNDESRVRLLFVEPTIRHLLESQQRICSFLLEVCRHDVYEVPGHPESNIDELWFVVYGYVIDTTWLKSMFELVAAILNRLRNMGLASDAKSYRLRQVGLDDSKVQEISRLSTRFRTW